MQVELQFFFGLKIIFQDFIFLQAETRFVALSRGNLDDEFVTSLPGQVVGHLSFIIFFRIIGDHEKNDRGNQERIKVTFKNIHWN